MKRLIAALIVIVAALPSAAVASTARTMTVNETKTVGMFWLTLRVRPAEAMLAMGKKAKGNQES